MDIPLYDGQCVGITKETFSNRKKRCLVDRLNIHEQNRDFTRDVCFQRHVIFQAAV